MNLASRFIAWLAVLAFIAAAPPAGAGLVRGQGARPAVVLVAGGPGGQKELHALATALKVGGYQVVSLAPDGLTGGLAGLAQRLPATVDGLVRGGASQVALISHGAGGLGAAAYLRAGHPSQLDRALFLALPVEGLSPPPPGSACRQAWRERVERFYGPDIMAQAAPGAPLATELAAQGLPLTIMAGGIAGRLDATVVQGMLTRAGCDAELAKLPGDGVVADASLAGLPGFARDDRDYLVPGDHLDLPGGREAMDLVLRFLKLKPSLGSVAVVLVMDGSGSIRKVDAAGMRKAAVRLLISRLMPGDRVGVVSFNTKASTVLPLTGIVSSAQAASVAAQGEKLPTGGDTDIGAGLARAAELLASAPPDLRRIVVLLTDGRNDPEEANGPTLEAARRLAGMQASLYAVGLTDKVDELFLASLAAEANGDYLFAADADELVSVFDRLQADIDRRSLIMSVAGQAPAHHQLTVDSTMSRLELNLMGSAPGTTLSFTGPDGAPAAPAAVPGRTATTYILKRPAPGPWKLEVRGPAGAGYRLQAFAATSLTARLLPQPEPVEAGRPFDLALTVDQDDLPLGGCKAQVSLAGPQGQSREILLEPQAQSGFSASRSAEGGLAARVPGLALAGDWRLTARITGANRLGQPFARLVMATLHVSDAAERKNLTRTLQGRAPRWGGRP